MRNPTSANSKRVTQVHPWQPLRGALSAASLGPITSDAAVARGALTGFDGRVLESRHTAGEPIIAEAATRDVAAEAG